MVKPRSKDNILYGDDRQKFLNSCQNSKEKLICYFLLLTGFRISEFVHMQKDWIDFKKNVIKIPLRQKCSCSASCKKELWRYVRNAEGEIISNKSKLIKPSGYWQVKTKNASRFYPIPSLLKDYLYSYFSKHKTIIETIHSRIEAWKIITAVGKRAGLKVFPHSLRSTRNVIFIEKNVNPNDIRDLLGHGSVRVQDEYTKLDIERMKKIEVDL